MCKIFIVREGFRNIFTVITRKSRVSNCVTSLARKRYRNPARTVKLRTKIAWDCWPVSKSEARVTLLYVYKIQKLLPRSFHRHFLFQSATHRDYRTVVENVRSLALDSGWIFEISIRFNSLLTFRTSLAF